MEMMVWVAIVITLCLVLSTVSGRFGVPSLLIFIVLGMIFGSDGIFKIPLDDFGLVEQICSIALTFIMFYGGFGTNWTYAGKVAGRATVLSTLGVVLTAGLTAVFCHWGLGIGGKESFLLGALISSTDAASVFSILRGKRLHLKDGTASLLELESGSNDPMAYLLTIGALTWMAGDNLTSLAGQMALQIIVGILMGIATAAVAIWVLKAKRLTADGYGTIFVVAAVIGCYALTQIWGGNGYLAVYLFGILLGNNRIIDKVPLVHFFDGLTGQAQIAIFFLLGLLAFPSRIPDTFGAAVLITVVLTFIIRPLVIAVLLKPFGCGWRQIGLVSFAGLRGAASIVFAIMALVGGADVTRDIFHMVFSICLLSIAFQGTLLPAAAHALDMVDAHGDVMKTFNDYQVEQSLNLIRSRIPSDHPWVGKAIKDIIIGLDVLIVMIIRGRRSLIPRGDTVIAAGDVVVFGGTPFTDERAASLEEVILSDGHPWIGLPVYALPLQTSQLAVLIKQADGETEIPHGNTVLKDGDTVVIRTV